MLPLRNLSRSAGFWKLSFLLWFLLLNLLSHGDRFQPSGGFFLNIPHFDKVAHFGYFFGGGGLLAAALYFSRPGMKWRHLVLIVTVTLSLVGIWDEFHQSFFENRTGNDPGDWTADTLGALCGALVFRKVHRVLLPSRGLQS